MTASNDPLRVGLVGVGVVGAAVARALVDAGHAVVLLGGGERARTRLAADLGDRATVGADLVDDHPTIAFAGTDVGVLCGPDELQPDQARGALAAGAHVVATADATASVDALLRLDDFAREVGRTVIVGVAATPGWTSLLVRHAAGLLDEIDEIATAVTGTGGPECAERRARAARTDTQEWRDGAWVEGAARSAPELVWFPDPLGAVDCARGDASEPVLLRRVLPDVAQIVAKIGRPVIRQRPRRLPNLGRSAPPPDPGGARIAVSGRAGGQPRTVVYGMLSPLGSATAALVGIAVAEITAPDGTDAGARGVAELLDPVDALRAGAASGIRWLTFDGID